MKTPVLRRILPAPTMACILTSIAIEANAATIITPDSIASTTLTPDTGTNRGSLTSLVDGISDSVAGQSIFFAPNANTLPGTISLSFDSPQDLAGFRLWNGWLGPGHAVEDFSLTFRDSTGTTIGSAFSGTALELTTTLDPSAFEDFSFAPVVNVTTVDFSIQTSLNSLGPELREVAFIAAVPEPSSVLLSSLGLMGLLVRRKR